MSRKSLILYECIGCLLDEMEQERQRVLAELRREQEMMSQEIAAEREADEKFFKLLDKRLAKLLSEEQKKLFTRSRPMRRRVRSRD